MKTIQLEMYWNVQKALDELLKTEQDISIPKSGYKIGFSPDRKYIWLWESVMGEIKHEWSSWSPLYQCVIREEATKIICKEAPKLLKDFYEIVKNSIIANLFYSLEGVKRPLLINDRETIGIEIVRRGHSVELINIVTDEHVIRGGPVDQVVEDFTRLVLYKWWNLHQDEIPYPNKDYWDYEYQD